MNRSEQIQTTAAQLKHNIEARESLRTILSQKYDKGEKDSTTYKLLSKQFDRADNNVERLRYDLGELNARLTPNFVLEIY